MEKKLENALRAEGYSDESIYDSRRNWRVFAFTPDTRGKNISAIAIKKSLSLHSKDIRKSRNFCRIIKAIERGKLRLKKKKNRIPLFDVDSSTLPFLVEEG